MKKSEAITLLNNIAITIQKCRSIVREGQEDTSDEIFAWLNPYLFGKKCPLDVILKAIETENFDRLFINNILYICTDFEPLIAVEGTLLGFDIPEPDFTQTKFESET